MRQEGPVWPLLKAKTFRCCTADSAGCTPSWDSPGHVLTPVGFAAPFKGVPPLTKFRNVKKQKPKLESLLGTETLGKIACAPQRGRQAGAGRGEVGAAPRIGAVVPCLSLASPCLGVLVQSLFLPLQRLYPAQTAKDGSLRTTMSLRAIAILLALAVAGEPPEGLEGAGRAASPMAGERPQPAASPLKPAPILPPNCFRRERQGSWSAAALAAGGWRCGRRRR